MQTFSRLRSGEAAAITAVAGGDSFAIILDVADVPASPVAIATARLYVEVPPPGTPDAQASLDRAVAIRPAGLIVRDVDSGRDVTLVDARLAVAEADLGIADGAIRIIAVAGSTPAALFAMDSFIGCSMRLSGLVHDPAALARSLGAEDPADLQRIARALTVAAAHAAGVVAIDGDDRIDADTARREGFGGKIVGGPTR